MPKVQIPKQAPEKYALELVHHFQDNIRTFAGSQIRMAARFSEKLVDEVLKTSDRSDVTEYYQQVKTALKKLT